MSKFIGKLTVVGGLLTALTGLGATNSIANVTDTTAVSNVTVSSPLYLEHAKNLLDAKSGTMVADHYSHESHQSHYSHYSSRD